MPLPPAHGPARRARASLERVLDDLGTTLLDLVVAAGDPTEDIGGVVIHDPVDAPVLPRRALVLGVGVDGPDATAALLDDLGERDAAALVLRSPVPSAPEVAAAAERSGVSLLGLARGAPWAHLLAMLRAVLAGDEGSRAAPDTFGALPSGDLFAVANAVSALLDAPVTVEDRNSRVLAFSGRQDEADPPRVETILGRQVPERYARVLHERGVFRHLLRSDEPVYVDPIEADDGPGTIPRVAIAVRAGDELLGSIWAAVPGPLSAQRTDALREATGLVALHLLRLRAGADVERRVRADLVSAVLDGGTDAREALERLGLTDTPLVLLALEVPEPRPEAAADPAVTRERQRLGDAFAMHLGAVNPRSASALVGGVTYGLAAISGPPADGEAQAARVAEDFLSRIGGRLRTTVAVGPVGSDLEGVVHARSVVDRVLRVLRDRRGGSAVARLVDVQTEALVIELRDQVLARGETVVGPLALLVDYDRQHDAQLVATLRAWLDAHGDVALAARASYVHVNTFRYRLRRVREVAGADLDDPDQRFALALQLRVWPSLAPPASGPPA